MSAPTHNPASNIPPDQQDLFLTFVDTVADYAIVLLDINGVITSWNRGAQRMLGYDGSEAIGLHFSRLYTEDAIARGWPQKALLLTQRHRKLEDGGWLMRKDGSRFWCSNSITAVHNSDDVLMGMGMVIRDVTQQMESSERLRESESTFRLLVQNVYDYAIFMLDTEGRVASWNVGANRIKGYASREIVGQHFSVFYSPEDRTSGKPERLLSIARDQGRVQDEGWRVRKDGTQFWASVTLTAVYDEHHQLVGFAKITRDMSERRHLEEVEASARRMNEFLATLAHELRNPLAPMFNATAIIEKHPDDGGLVRANLSVVLRQLRHLSRLVDDLLDVGRMAVGKLELRSTVLPIQTVIETGLEACLPLLAAKQQRIELQLCDENFHVFGDLTRLSQVLQNVLNNASKFSAEGTTIVVECKAWDKIGTISIADQGRGIPRDMLSDIFNLFVQVDEPGYSATGGLGIGLSLCKSIIEKHAGSISATSTGPGQGSTFTIQLPIATQTSAPEEPHMTEPSVSGMKILIVDDNHDAADSLGMFLQMEGHAIEVAYDGVSAIHKVSTFVPDVALIDLAMPDMDGYELIEELREFAKLNHTRFYALTGFSETAVRDRVAEAGFNGHIVKPINPAALKKTIFPVGSGNP
ncbi:Multidomain signal transduction protein [Cupriavidus sp. U2]|uniref:hybrid sensor histidine kinase/response regulator n=1 Tax=Cupriavidus sp. U2 TaxID=2920269 RepID=UPI00129DB1E5|nr:PAS domain S-box protein [Cupriavidus sp. U2]KAI3591002.1 Multidomain signal transduction protein [Cupriavidus sp. U2]